MGTETKTTEGKKRTTPVVNPSAPPSTIIPVLIYEDVSKAVDWLCYTFGFTERLRAGNDHAQLTVGDGSIMLGRKCVGQGFGSPDSAEFRPPRPNEVSHYIHVKVEDVDRHYEHARQRGARVLEPPANHPFGERQYTAEDLGGHRWTFSQSIADVDPKEWGATPAKIG